MPFFVQGFFDDHVLRTVIDTPKNAVAEAVEWQMLRGFSDVSISDGTHRYSIAEFSKLMALRGIEETI